MCKKKQKNNSKKLLYDIYINKTEKTQHKGIATHLNLNLLQGYTQ